jgi:hypothetical protein
MSGASSAGTQEPTGRRGVKAFGIAALVLMVLVSAALVWLRSRDAEHDAIRRLSDAERRALYERTLRTLRSSCDPKTRPQGLADFCRAQADFILKFPECDSVCTTLAAEFRQLPTR